MVGLQYVLIDPADRASAHSLSPSISPRGPSLTLEHASKTLVRFVPCSRSWLFRLSGGRICSSWGVAGPS